MSGHTHTRALQLEAARVQLQHGALSGPRRKTGTVSEGSHRREGPRNESWSAHRLVPAVLQPGDLVRQFKRPAAAAEDTGVTGACRAAGASGRSRQVRWQRCRPSRRASSGGVIRPTEGLSPPHRRRRRGRRATGPRLCLPATGSQWQLLRRWLWQRRTRLVFTSFAVRRRTEREAHIEAVLYPCAHRRRRRRRRRRCSDGRRNARANHRRQSTAARFGRR